MLYNLSGKTKIAATTAIVTAVDKLQILREIILTTGGDGVTMYLKKGVAVKQRFALVNSYLSKKQPHFSDGRLLF